MRVHACAGLEAVPSGGGGLLPAGGSVPWRVGDLMIRVGRCAATRMLTTREEI